MRKSELIVTIIAAELATRDEFKRMGRPPPEALRDIAHRMLCDKGRDHRTRVLVDDAETIASAIFRALIPDLVQMLKPFIWKGFDEDKAKAMISRHFRDDVTIQYEYTR